MRESREARAIDRSLRGEVDESTLHGRIDLSDQLNEPVSPLSAVNTHCNSVSPSCTHKSKHVIDSFCASSKSDVGINRGFAVAHTLLECGQTAFFDRELILQELKGLKHAAVVGWLVGCRRQAT